MTSVPGWLYNEFQQIGVDFEDTTQVEVFDRNQKSSTPEAEQALVERLGISIDDTVIDLGTGTGTFAVQAALAGAKVYAVDVSRVMLTYAQQKAQKMNAENIEFHQSGFLSYQHQGEPVDFIVTKSALHHLPDFWKMVAFLRMASMLKFEGILYLRDVVFSFNPMQYQTHIDAWINRVAKLPGEGFTANDFEAHLREEYSTFTWIIEGMLQRAGFEITDAYYPAQEYAQYLCTKVK
ncbi:MAG: methyltransferase domain-containing protein, partial [Scytonema sp. PMC 1069.18]|nr:methyltransferase domain-containing protein [Scytonema sp. PMC 1069.18]MEC4886154.1 methyltransferase domain-containing protein [Scytonema sp. PMC 1070.18]